jgi:hypothetical protein
VFRRFARHGVRRHGHMVPHRVLTGARIIDWLSQTWGDVPAPGPTVTGA